MKYLSICLLALLLMSCDDDLSMIFVPSAEDSLIPEDTETTPSIARDNMEGVYTVIKGKNVFGSQAVLKWSSSHLSVFTGKSATYVILEGGYKDSTFYFEGYWRAATGSATGRLVFQIANYNGSADLLNGNTPDSIIVDGFYGHDNNQPSNAFKFIYRSPLNKNNPDFYIIGHRGGGRNVDRLPYSENSLGMIKFAERLGANAVEIDIMRTKDGIPVLFHDKYMNKRLINEDYFIGQISDYTFAQLRTFVTLVNGERIPTLEEALETILQDTQLQLVWLDMKSVKALPDVISLQKEYLERAAAEGRNLEILIGIPDKDILKAFMKVEDHHNIASLCELKVSDVLKINALVWAPRWSLGLLNEQISTIHSSGRKVFIWTLDEQVLIKKFLNDSEMDGFITNYPSLGAYEYYRKN